jgi:hypothetical protein
MKLDFFSRGETVNMVQRGAEGGGGVAYHVEPTQHIAPEIGGGEKR